MRFYGLTPTEFSLLFCLAAAAAVVFYLLSFQRRRMVVATDPIWRQVAGRRRTPFRKLLALLVQIAVLFLLSLAMADPRSLPGGIQPPVAVAVVLDASASMGTVERDGTRLEEAAEIVRAAAAAMGPRDRMMLLAMDDGCRPLQRFTADPAEIAAALGGLAPSSVAEDFDRALAFALSALQSGGLAEDVKRRLVVVSDRFHRLPAGADLEGVELLQLAVGHRSDNLSVSAFELRRRGGAARGSELFVEVSNHGRRARRTRLSIHTPDVLLGEEELELPAGGRVSRSYFLEPVSDPRVMASLSAPSGGGSADAFALDDRAYGLVPERRARRVLLVTAGNLYLEKALQLDPSVDVDVVAPGDFSAAGLSAYQAAVFDGLCPDSSVPAIYFDLNAGQAGCPFELAGSVEQPALLPLRGDHPVTENLSLVDVQIATARRLVPLAGDRELLVDEAGPLAIARELDGRKALGFGFDVKASDLPLRIAFPLLLHNSLSWMMGAEPEAGIDEHAAGRAMQLPPWTSGRARVLDPDGRSLPLRLLGGRRLLHPRAPGFYSLRDGGRSQILAVNFQDPGESRLAGDRRAGEGRFALSAGEKAAPPPALLSGFDKTEAEEPPLQWPMLLLAAAWLLLFDWVFFTFRILF